MMTELRSPTNKQYKVCEPTLHGNEIRYVLQALMNNEISVHGSFVKEFEQKFAETHDCKYGIAVCTGGQALWMSLMALDIGLGDEVIVPTFTMVATANAVSILGAKPVFVDCKDDGCINEALIEAKITEKTKAIIPVHIYGNICEMDTINEIANKHKLAVIEDCAEAHGGEDELGKMVGSFGDIACFSFYANKLITTGEGGMIITNSKKIYDICQQLKNYAISPEKHFWHKRLALNGRMTNLQAAVGLAQLERLKELKSARDFNNFSYSQELQGIPCLKVWKPDTTWMVCIEVKDKRDYLMKKLAEQGIETRTFFIPMHLQPIYLEVTGYQEPNSDSNTKYPVSERLMREGMYLPSASHLKELDIKYISATIKKILEE